MKQTIIKRTPLTVTDIDSIRERLPEAPAKDVKRQLRKPLLNALDIYDKNVTKGRVTETAEEKVSVDKWYKALLDLEDWAFNDIPEKVKRYL